MRIGIISDTHNRADALQSALQTLRHLHIDTFFHCGDVTTLETARLMLGFTVHYVFGNGDADSIDIQNMLTAANPESSGGLVYTGQIDGVRIAAAHGHIAGKVNALVASGEYDYVFHGHTHVQKDEMIGRTRIINPGALGSNRYDGRCLCILDLKTGQIEYPRID
ncbi:MAG: hypothetical protein C0396_08540 [Anaerolinea sp.]|nr:hypothetical protein [Anaerolinea sp.]